jgi:nitroreductase
VFSNPILKAIKDRRSVSRFKSEDIGQDKIDAIIEAARWAPSFVNSQPWNIIVVKDKDTRQRLRELAVTIAKVGIEESPVTFVVSVDPKKDPYHYVEDGSAATQNMALAAHSMGLGSYWVGVYDVSGNRASSEDKIKKLLSIPAEHRVISMLPVGVPTMAVRKDRKQTSEFVYHDTFGKRS